MNCAYARSFQPTGATQNAAMDGTAKTITIANPGDKDGTVHIAAIGTQTVFVRVDGTTPTTSNALPILANTTRVLSVPVGGTTVKAIGAAGSTVYVTPGRGA